MANTLKIKRGLETNRSGQTPAAGEPLWVTDDTELWIGDGTTAGGVRATYDPAKLILTDTAAAKTAGDLTFNDNVNATFGSGGDMQVRHDGTLNEINLVAGDLEIQDNGTARVTIARTTGDVTADGTGHFDKVGVNLAGAAPNSQIHANGSIRSSGTSTGQFYLERVDATIIQGNTIGQITFQGDEGLNKTCAQIKVSVPAGGTWTEGSSHPGSIDFQTVDDGEIAVLSRLLINSDGTIKIADLAGTGTRSISADSSGNLVADEFPPQYTQRSFVATATVAARDVCYLASTGQMVVADADAVSTGSGMIGLAAGAITASSSGAFYLAGEVTGYTGLTPGDIMYLSTTAGGITATPPSGSGDVVRVIGYALTSTSLWLDPDKTWIELT